MKVKIIGGGLAGCEAAYQLLKEGVDVELHEMRPVKNTPCHKTDKLCELVCSNSLKSMEEDTASGTLKAELERLDSMVLECAYNAAVPSGSALGVDRNILSALVENRLKSYENFKLVIGEVAEINPDEWTIVASGPLTSDALAEEIKNKLQVNDDLYFYDAVAPIISADSVDYEKAFFATRYGKGEMTDYLNCPFEKEDYEVFYKALIEAKSVELKEFEKLEVFEGCMPIEVMAKRGADTIRYGMLKPVGLRDERFPDKRFFAVAQLRRENINGTMYNLVGFQTNLTFPEQKRVFSLIPGLENAEFLRYGVMHRNTYINSPKFLREDFSLKSNQKISFAGQITGVEGYMESVASGLIASLAMKERILGREFKIPSENTMIGSLARHVAYSNPESFQPMNANFGILPPSEELIKDKKLRKQYYFERSEKEMFEYCDYIRTL